MYNALLEQIINEANIKIEPIEVYGSNISKYDDQKIGYLAIIKSYFIGFAVDDGYVAVAVSREDGSVRYAYSQNAYIGRMIHLPAMNKRTAIMEATSYFPQILFCLSLIMKSFHMRIPQLQFVSRFPIQDRYHRFLFRSPAFKMLLKRYKFRNIKRDEVENNDGDKFIVYNVTKGEE